MKLNLPTTNADAATHGVWVEFGGGIEFRIASAGNMRYRTEANRLAGNSLSVLRHRKGSITDRDAEVHLRASAKTVLVDWRGIKDESGDEWTYSEDRAYELLSESKWTEVALFVWEVANDMRIYREAAVEEAEGN